MTVTVDAGTGAATELDPEVFDDVLASVRAFVRGKVVPLEEVIDAEDRMPEEIVVAAREMGLYGFTIPQQYGGLGVSVSQEVRLVTELGWTTPALRSLFGTNNGIAGQVLIRAGTSAQRADWLPRLASGALASFALTEEGAGSDPSGMTTRAVRTEQGWRIDGAKRFITNAPSADVFMVFAQVDVDGTDRITVFLVPADVPGITVGPRDSKMGQKGAASAEVFLDGVLVGHDAVVGGEEALGSGYRTALTSLAHGRIHIAALCVGMMERLLVEAGDQAAQRVQGGRPIGEHQLIAGLLADMQTDLAAGRALVAEAARAWDAGEDRSMLPSAAKYFCSEAVGRCADRAVQIFGGSGYMRGVAVERMYRDARLFRIYEGTSQIQQVILGRHVVAEARERLTRAGGAR
ncbi:acyl-CoA dehydrogenase family protein [Nocardioides yefusunii]|uniref:Acyl-CoA dehydrogenase family protein n=1 Tax=Nocardioides yefusunii TaxID=2500546 RepID=A0ABW1QTP0_9ACTN|nr:acyl-CoA dehydrogenase family protein [Nocardioides yefusunii]